MTSFKKIALSLAVVSAGLYSGLASAADYYFYVANQAGKTIKYLLVSPDGNNMGFFDIGSGIPNGKQVKINWDTSTNGESCTQYIIAAFSENDLSEPAKIDFCSDMDTPIVFE